MVGRPVGQLLEISECGGFGTLVDSETPWSRVIRATICGQSLFPGRVALMNRTCAGTPGRRDRVAKRPTRPPVFTHRSLSLNGLSGTLKCPDQLHQRG